MVATVHLADNYSQSQMIGLGIFFIILPIVAVALRIWAKLLGPRGIATDDILVLFGLAFAVGCGSVQLVAAIDGQLGQHQTVKPDGQPLLDDPRFVTYEKAKFAVNILSTVGLGFTKASFLLFYMSIFTTRRFRISAQLVLGLVICWTISFFFANLFTCYPISPFIEAFYKNHCVDGLALWYSMAITDIIVDFFILLLPIPVVLRLQLPLQQRIGVLAMFFWGAIVIAFSITRALVYVHVGQRLTEHYNDETYYTSPVFFWCTIELSTAVLSASLPIYRPIWLHLSSRGTKKSKLSYRLGSYPRDHERYREHATHGDDNDEHNHDEHNHKSAWQDANSQRSAKILLSER